MAQFALKAGVQPEALAVRLIEARDTYKLLAGEKYDDFIAKGREVVTATMKVTGEQSAFQMAIQLAKDSLDEIGSITALLMLAVAAETCEADDMTRALSYES